MKLLSGTDSLFLHMEQGNQYMHVAGLGIYDPSTAPGGKVRFKQILDFFSRRLDSQGFRRRLVAAPLGLDRPHWIDGARSTPNTMSVTSRCRNPATGGN